MITFSAPLPPKELNPNARVHWAKKARAAKAMRALWYVLALPFRRDVNRESTSARLTMTFCFATAAKRDSDNFLAACKAGRDGLADGLNVNDSIFNPVIVFIGPPDKKNPHVKIVVYFD